MNQPNPSEYLRKKQREHPSYQIDKRYLTFFVREKLAESPDLSEFLNGKNHRDYALILLSMLRSRLPIQLLQIIDSEAVAIGEVNDSCPNAHFEPLGDGKFAITFNSGLRDFNYRVVRAFSTRFTPQGNSQEETVSFQDTCLYISDIFLWLGEIGSANGPDYPITEDQIQLASLLTNEVNCFFLAHELGHGMFHLNGIESEVDYPEIDSDIEWEEYFADEIAFHVILSGLDESRDLSSLQVSYAAIELALMIWQGLERFGFVFENTHPTAVERIERLRRILLETFPEPDARAAVTGLAEPVRIVFNNILKEIDSSNYESFIDRAAKDVVSVLDDLLDHCTGGLYPDYYTFCERADSLFNKGLSIKLSQQIATITKTLFDKMESAQSKPSSSDRRETNILFQKYKLFYHYINGLRPEVKTVFQKALGISSDN